jgi:hypothetical protein
MVSPRIAADMIRQYKDDNHSINHIVYLHDYLYSVDEVSGVIREYIRTLEQRLKEISKLSK